jgi:hypothetical protein
MAGGAPWTVVVCDVAVLIAVTEFRVRFVTNTVPTGESADAPAGVERTAGSGPMRRVSAGIQSARRIRRRPTEAMGNFIAIVTTLP